MSYYQNGAPPQQSYRQQPQGTGLEGTHPAKAIEWSFGYSSKGTEQVGVVFEITDGEHKGRTIAWYGYFSDAAIQRTLASLRSCGWSSDSLEDLSGMGAKTVQIVIEDEWSDKGRAYPKVKWVNKPSPINHKSEMSPQQKAAFAARVKAASGAGSPSTSGPYQPPQQPRTQPQSSYQLPLEPAPAHFSDAPELTDDDILF